MLTGEKACRISSTSGWARTACYHYIQVRENSG